MPQTIAVAGKGGVGKTTLTGMLIQYLAEKKERPDPGGGCRCKRESERSARRGSRGDAG